MLKIKKAFVVATFASLSSFSALAAAPLCAGLFADPSPALLQKEDQQAIAMHEYLSEKLVKDSRRIEMHLKTSNYVPVVVIGNGLHGSIFNNRAGLLGKADSVLAIEASTRVSKVFGELGGSFRINSREAQHESTNVFPGSPVQMKDFTSAFFPNSIHMGLMATVTQRTSNVPLLLGHKVVSVVDTRMTGEPAKARYKVITEQGLAVYTDKVVISTGLGAPSSRVKDASFDALLKQGEAVHQVAPEKLSPVMMVDSFLRTMTLKETNKIAKIDGDVKNKTIAVIGVGDGARIAIEAIVEKMDPTVKVLWLGQKAQNVAEYRESTWFRYHGLAPEMGQRVLGGFAGYVTAGKQLPNGKIELTYGEQNQTVSADYVINATGYDNVVPSLVQSITGKTQKNEVIYEDIKALRPEISTTETIIGKRLKIEGLPVQDIYVIGPAGGAHASPAELNYSTTQNPVSVENLGPRSRAMADYLLVGLGLSVKNPLTSGYSLKSGFLKPQSGPLLLLDKQSLYHVVKTEAHRALRPLGVPASGILLRVRHQGTSIEVSVLGLSAPSAQKALESVLKDSDLTALLEQAARRASSFSVSIK